MWGGAFRCPRASNGCAVATHSGHSVKASAGRECCSKAFRCPMALWACITSVIQEGSFSILAVLDEATHLEVCQSRCHLALVLLEGCCLKVRAKQPHVVFRGQCSILMSYPIKMISITVCHVSVCLPPDMCSCAPCAHAGRRTPAVGPVQGNWHRGADMIFLSSPFPPFFSC